MRCHLLLQFLFSVTGLADMTSLPLPRGLWVSTSNYTMENNRTGKGTQEMLLFSVFSVEAPCCVPLKTDCWWNNRVVFFLNSSQCFTLLSQVLINPGRASVFHSQHSEASLASVSKCCRAALTSRGLLRGRDMMLELIGSPLQAASPTYPIIGSTHFL